MSKDTNIIFQTAAEVIQKIKSKEISITEVMDAYLKQINKVNDKVNAIVSLDEEKARMDAKEAEEKFMRNEDIGKLYGLPIAIKDTHDAKGFPTTRGSTIFKNSIATEDEAISSNLKNDGAIIIGKTNVPEFAAGSHTFNPVFGPTNNPYDLTKSAGGSSGGAAAAVASGMLPFADGSDMGGSCRNPAAYNNIVGLRPSPGRVPMSSKTALYSPMGVQGPLAKSVEDIALMMSSISTFNPSDALSSSKIDFENDLSVETKGLKIAYSEDLNRSFPLEPTVRKMFQKQLSVFTDLGCSIEEVNPDFTGATQAFQTFRAYEFALNLKDLYATRKEDIKETVQWNIEKGLNLGVDDLFQADKNRHHIHTQMNKLFEHYDFLIMPVSQVQPFDVNIEYPTNIDGVPMDNYIQWMESCSHITVAGNPAISVPAGFCENGLPFGLQIVAPFKQDFKLLQIAYAFEQATNYKQYNPNL